MTHAWCRDIARDAAVRAAEDGRTGPLPTLEEAIASPFTDAAERSVPVSKTGGVLAQIAAAFNCVPEDDDDLVEAARLLVRERDEAVAKAASGGGEQPRGWLTEEERKAVTLAAEQAPESDFVTNEEGERLRAVLTSLLARSSPPEVVLRDFPSDSVRNLDTHYLAGWNQCMALAKKAIVEAGVAVKAVG
jgi:hypothetical protein